mmetsp:Transcript_104480/g.280747  ORF Transcript_104480/g.280747 Transcript_104480/m.280747 type:complete len:296 (-) Transcript_104480:41-928(-)
MYVSRPLALALCSSLVLLSRALEACSHNADCALEEDGSALLQWDKTVPNLKEVEEHSLLGEDASLLAQEDPEDGDGDKESVLDWHREMDMLPRDGKVSLAEFLAWNDVDPDDAKASALTKSFHAADAAGNSDGFLSKTNKEMNALNEVMSVTVSLIQPVARTRSWWDPPKAPAWAETAKPTSPPKAPGKEETEEEVFEMPKGLTEEEEHELLPGALLSEMDKLPVDGKVSKSELLAWAEVEPSSELGKALMTHFDVVDSRGDNNGRVTSEEMLDLENEISTDKKFVKSQTVPDPN